MTLKEDIFAHLSTHPGLSALIGTRIYPIRPPQEPVLPCVAWIQVSSLPTYAHNGATNFSRARIQFDCLGADPIQTEVVANAVKDALDSWKATDSRFTGFETSRSDSLEPDLERNRIILEAFIMKAS